MKLKELNKYSKYGHTNETKEFLNIKIMTGWFSLPESLEQCESKRKNLKT